MFSHIQASYMGREQPLQLLCDTGAFGRFAINIIAVGAQHWYWL